MGGPALGAFPSPTRGVLLNMNREGMFPPSLLPVVMGPLGKLLIPRANNYACFDASIGWGGTNTLPVALLPLTLSLETIFFYK